MSSRSELIERLADLEHKQWMNWSKNIAETESISLERFNRWQQLWIDYNDLTEEQKEQDRVWAVHSVKIFENWLQGMIG